MEYYGSILGCGNLYVIFDGKDQQIPDFCSGVNVIVKDRVEGKVVKADKGRIRCISSLARGLMERYDLAIGVDVDEFLVVDPACGVTLPEYLDSIDIKSTVSGLGVDVGQHLEKESEVNPGKPFLSQRHFGYLSSRYTKASVIAGPQRWAPVSIGSKGGISILTPISTCFISDVWISGLSNRRWATGRKS